ncbi:hypothetical protein ADIARSV_3932 [Arcticibacter svalbardensis MN12-7]|uniref:Uncharacterized protein n=1 Tax=Arcticibacter svalbardensis MN12-7 TaxID=1150600 RepID=R9GV83_9SPHI|nr:hypothetical protein ADIARSV_3932 [Arcticibacter svalbardensis MN12-7]
MLASADFNFKRMMNKWKSSLFGLFFNSLKLVIFIFNNLLEIQMKSDPKQINNFKTKWTF